MKEDVQRTVNLLKGTCCCSRMQQMKLPCVHVYQGGELVSMHRIGKRQLFYEFEESIERLATYGV